MRGAWATVVAVALVIAAGAYANSLAGQFVWDDNAQIVDNALIREPGRLGKAVTSDVWAFAGERPEPWTRYWRPLFVLWLAAGWRAFGLDPFGWHVTTVLLHGTVIVLGAEVLRRLRAPLAVAAATLWVFAAHPTHTESVAWIAGATDPLVAVFFLGSFAAWLASRERARARGRALALALCGAALLSKELGVVLPALVFVTEWVLAGPGMPAAPRARRALGAAWPFLALTGLFLLARALVLGPAGSPAQTVPELAASLLSAPAVIAFYLRHLLWPIGLGPIYPFEKVTPDALGWASFVGPALAVAAVAAGAAWVARRAPAYAAGAALFALTLAPVLNVGAFPAERLVHDRFLYLPSLGGLLLAAGAVHEALRARAAERAGLVLGVGAAALALACSVATLRYNRVWRTDVALWKHAREVHPDSPYVLANLGYHYRTAGRAAEARPLLERAVALEPTLARAHVDLALIAMDLGRLERAERLLRTALAADPANAAALERLAVLHALRGRPAEAIAAFDEVRRRVPWLRVRSTVNIAVLLREAGRPAAALAELESVALELQRESDPGALGGLWHLGEIYREAGRPAAARRAYEVYLARTADARDPAVAGLRERARQRLEVLAAGG